jgi:hypothetical protein
VEHIKPILNHLDEQDHKLQAALERILQAFPKSTSKAGRSGVEIPIDSNGQRGVFTPIEPERFDAKCRGMTLGSLETSPADR